MWHTTISPKQIQFKAPAKTKWFFLLFFCYFSMLVSCKKTSSDSCHCDHKIDGNASSNYDVTTSDCSECSSQSRTYDSADEIFSTITHHHVVTCSCQ
jgi:hypothetical protein